MFNGTIRSISIGYVNFCISTQAKIQDMVRDPDSVTAGGVIGVVVWIVFLLGYCSISCFWLVRNYDKLD